MGQTIEVHHIMPQSPSQNIYGSNSPCSNIDAKTSQHIYGYVETLYSPFAFKFNLNPVIHLLYLSRACTRNSNSTNKECGKTPTHYLCEQDLPRPGHLCLAPYLRPVSRNDDTLLNASTPDSSLSPLSSNPSSSSSPRIENHSISDDVEIPISSASDETSMIARASQYQPTLALNPTIRIASNAV